MNGIVDKLLALFALGSIVALPILLVVWLLFPKKRREPEPELEAAAAVAASLIVQGR